MTATIQILLPVISLLVSGYILYLYFIQKQNNNLIEENQLLIEKEILKNQEELKKLELIIKKQEESISSTKYALKNDISNLEKKVIELYDRWSIVADDRITSIPQNNKEWWEAREIIKQEKQKEWKPKNLSQSKTSFVNGNVSSIIDEEINQDFTEFNDEDFDNILDEEDDTSSSSATDNTQLKKPKTKSKSNQMKM